ncbi:MAG: aldo/keto reductase, partial [Mycobacteriales bacterium]
MTTNDVFQRALPLPAGGQMPLLGFGTWQMTGGEARQAVGWALDAGYRHLDTATMYRNEAELGAAIAESGVVRDEIFLTTKLPPSRAGAPRDTLQQSLEALGVDQVDLWLIHAPPQRSV